MHFPRFLSPSIIGLLPCAIPRWNHHLVVTHFGALQAVSSMCIFCITKVSLFVHNWPPCAIPRWNHHLVVTHFGALQALSSMCICIFQAFCFLEQSQIVSFVLLLILRLPTQFRLLADHLHKLFCKILFLGHKVFR
jgi:hypothetical protein